MHRSLVALVVVALLAGPAAAQISQTGTGGLATNATTLTFSWTHAGGVGSNGVVVVAVAAEAAGSSTTDVGVAGVTYNGTAMTRLSGSNSSIVGGTSIAASVLYYLPTTVANGTVVVTSTSTSTTSFIGTGRVGTSVSLAGVNTAVAPTVAHSEAASATSIQTALTGLAANSWVVDAASNGSAGGTFTAGPTGANRVKEVDLSNPTSGLASALATYRNVSGSVTPSFTFSGATNRMTHSLAAFTPVPEPAVVLLVAAAGLAGWRRLRG